MLSDGVTEVLAKQRYWQVFSNWKAVNKSVLLFAEALQSPGMGTW